METSSSSRQYRFHDVRTERRIFPRSRLSESSRRAITPTSRTSPEPTRINESCTGQLNGNPQTVEPPGDGEYIHDDDLQIIMAMDIKDRGTMGYAYYVAAEEKLYILEDIVFGGENVFEMRTYLTPYGSQLYVLLLTIPSQS